MQVVRTYGDFALTSLVEAEGKPADAERETASPAVDASRQNKLKKQAEEESDDPFRMILVLQKQDG